ncbi:Uncharacterized conserved protein, contains GRAM domain [Ceraceosorus bombacis]|uniref:Uncharacterized conserved protein, contains GRAM domain n=1 Tax=Ceraceosorus bombacis TaxID=401625 RepID=A0A0P1BSA1_9BASI|nr:Uncharacterized conserved protein, contains GRAM domain [Ceraceosorus bombacis]
MPLAISSLIRGARKDTGQGSSQSQSQSQSPDLSQSRRGSLQSATASHSAAAHPLQRDSRVDSRASATPTAPAPTSSSTFIPSPSTTSADSNLTLKGTQPFPSRLPTSHTSPDLSIRTAAAASSSNMPRPGSAAAVFSGTGKVGRRGSTRISDDGHGRGASTGVPDRHELMRRAMADAAAHDILQGGESSGDEEPSRRGGAGNASAAPSNTRFNNVNPFSAQPPTAPARLANVDTSTANADLNTLNARQVEIPPASPGDRPGEGSLNLAAFTLGEIVHADGSVQPNPAVHSSTAGNGDALTASAAVGPGQQSKAPARPKLGSRNNSYASDMGEVTVSPSAASTATASPHKSQSGHGRYATTGTMAPSMADRGRASSLAPPTPRGTDSHSPSRSSAMHESASTSQLLPPSPLARLRKLSDGPVRRDTAESTKSAKRGPAGGIAGALAGSAIGAAGIGGSQGAMARQQAMVRSGSNLDANYVGGSEGGLYRNPQTGRMSEVGPDPGMLGTPSEEAIEGRRRALRERSTSSSFSFASDASEASGLGAAAHFSAAVAAGGLHAPHGLMPGAASLAPPTPRLVSAVGEPHLTPGGIGAVGGLSPAGTGEGVSLLDDDHAWPGDVGVGQQITGFAVASSKRNADFHALFPSVPEDDYLIEDYGCALVREILVQGRFYISENHVCFNANIFGWVTNIVIGFHEIVSIEKRMTAFVIPNAIQMATLHAKYTFASFLSRDATYDLIVNIWKLSHPSVPGQATIEVQSDDESVENEGDASKDGAAAKPTEQGAPRVSKRKKLRMKLKSNKEGAANGAGADSGANGMSGMNGAPLSPAVALGAAGGKKAPHRATSCPCEKEKKHMPTVALDQTYPAVPEKLYNLLFTSGFMKDFWTVDQKLMDLQMSDWSPDTANNNMLSRSMSYIKPLAGGFGPKQTKCVITDENLHVDMDDYVSTMTTTRTPDVPSGGSFAVKTRTCFTWAGGNTTKVYVTCNVEWSGRSMIKGIIDKASIDGQKQYYKDLDVAVRKYLKEHASEFREEGDDEAADEMREAVASTPAGETSVDPTSKESSKALASEASNTSEAGGIMGILSTICGTIADLTGGAIEMVGDLSPSMLILGALVLVLLLTNIWALTASGGASKRDPSDPHKLVKSRKSNSASSSLAADTANAEAIALAVRGVLQEYLSPVQQPRYTGQEKVLPSDPQKSEQGLTKDDVQTLASLLDDVEKRLADLKLKLERARSEENKKGKVDRKKKAEL